MSYQGPPDYGTDAVTGPPPGWYLDPHGLQGLRWWDGTQWSPHTQPLPGISQQPRPAYPDATASAAGDTTYSGRKALGGIGSRGGHRMVRLMNRV